MDQSGRENPFSDSRAASTLSLSSETHSSAYTPFGGTEKQPQQLYRYKSYRLRGEYQQPWVPLQKKNKNKKSSIIIWTFVVAALLLSGYINYAVARKAKRGDFCLILNDHFEKFDEDVWSHEVQINGFGTGSFDWTTADSKNAYVDSAGLHIVPTLTKDTTSLTDQQILDGYTLNLTQSADGDGSCTASTNIACSVSSNVTQGTIIPPVRSARINTKGKKSIKYGRVEVTAKLPQGSWLWPAIWMMPEDSVYGPWPASGEIDIMESRGNDVKYNVDGRDMGRDVYSSTLHWGPTPKTDAYQMSGADRAIRRTDYSKDFHVYGMEWTEDYIYTYLDKPSFQTMFYKFDGKKTMWERGYFANRVENLTIVADPWSQTGRTNTPFDESFYLILNVAVGSQNGWFLNAKNEKPWVDNSAKAAADFYKDINEWLPTWGKDANRGMTVKSVKMWQAGKCK